MIKLISSALFSLLIWFALFNQVNAADMTWFDNVQGREGYIEFQSPPQPGYQNRIHIFPRVIGPGNNNQIDATPSGVTINFKIVADVPGNTAQFTNGVLQKVASGPVSLPQGTGYQVTPIQPRNVTVKLRYKDQVLDQRVYDTNLASQLNGQLFYGGDARIISDLRKGNFLLETEFTINSAQFSSINLSVDERILVNSKVDAFKEVFQRYSSSGGSFLFIKWKRRSASKVIKESINSQTSASYTRNISSFAVDPTDAMLQRLDSLLGFAVLDKHQLIQNHRDAATKARQLGNVQLATLHDDYAKVVENNSALSQDQILKAVSALSKNNIMGFLVNGVAMGDATGSNRGKYYGFGSSTIDVNTRTSFQQMQLTSIVAKYTLAEGPFPNLYQRQVGMDSVTLSQIFGTSSPTQADATKVLINALATGDWGNAALSLRYDANINHRSLNNGMTLLMHAAAAGLYDFVSLLLRAGVDVDLLDSNGRRASDHAYINGYDDLAQQLRDVESAINPVSVNISVPSEINIISIAGKIDDSLYVKANRKLQLRLLPGDYDLEVSVSTKERVSTYALDNIIANYGHLPPSIKLLGGGGAGYRYIQLDAKFKNRLNVPDTKEVKNVVLPIKYDKNNFRLVQSEG